MHAWYHGIESTQVQMQELSKLYRICTVEGYRGAWGARGRKRRETAGKAGRHDGRNAERTSHKRRAWSKPHRQGNGPCGREASALQERACPDAGNATLGLQRQR